MSPSCPCVWNPWVRSLTDLLREGVETVFIFYLFLLETVFKVLSAGVWRWWWSSGRVSWSSSGALRRGIANNPSPKASKSLLSVIDFPKVFGNRCSSKRETPGSLSCELEVASSGFSFNPKPWPVGAGSRLKPQGGTLLGAALLPAQVKGSTVSRRPLRLRSHACSGQPTSKATRQGHS